MDVALLLRILVLGVVSLETSTGSIPAILVSLVLIDSEDDPVADTVTDSNADTVADISGIWEAVLVSVNSSEFIAQLSTFTHIL